jgi:DegV family protein with EDD domain
MSFTIFTDDSCDYIEPAEHAGLKVLRCALTMDGKDVKAPAPDEFYKLLPTHDFHTGQVTPNTFLSAFEPELAAGQDILYTGLAAGVSGTFNSSLMARETLLEKYPARRIICVDSASMCMGLGLLIHEVIKLRDAGANLDKLASFINDNKLRLVHLYTADDLIYFHRGGRVSTAVKIISDIAQIRPMLHIDNAGCLTKFGQTMGSPNRNLTKLVDVALNTMNSQDRPTIFIAHANCPEKADFVTNRIRTKVPNAEFIFGRIGPIIGTHAGPTTVAFFYFADHR